MKMMISVLVLAVSTTAFAADLSVIKAVLNSKFASHVQDVQKVEVAGNYKCPYCHDIVISGFGPFGEAYVKVKTEQVTKQDAKGKLLTKIDVQLVENSK